MTPGSRLVGRRCTRIRNAGIKNVGLIHRGFSAYGASLYRNNPMWHLAIEMRSRMPELPMICDPSHICGNRTYLQEVAQKSADLYYDGLILESHICPAKAWSDASQQVTPSDLETLLRSIVWRQSTADTPSSMMRWPVCAVRSTRSTPNCLSCSATGCGSPSRSARQKTE